MKTVKYLERHQKILAIAAEILETRISLRTLFCLLTAGSLLWHTFSCFWLADQDCIGFDGIFLLIFLMWKLCTCPVLSVKCCTLRRVSAPQMKKGAVGIPFLPKFSILDKMPEKLVSNNLNFWISYPNRVLAFWRTERIVSLNLFSNKISFLFG